MDINGVCHIVFCGRLEARFPGWAIKNTTRPGLGLAEPCKSRIFPALTVHNRPPFPFTFCFLPPVNSGGAVGTVFRPVGLWDERPTADRTAFQCLIPENLRFQRSDLRPNRPAEPLAADRERNGLGAGVGIPIVKEHTVPVLVVTALPADKRICLFSMRRGHAVGGAVRLALYGRQSFVWIFFHAFLRFSVAVLPEKASCPIPAACSGVGTLPGLRDILSRSGSLRCFPCRGIPFRTVILFSRCSSSMNYLKSTPKRPPAPYIHKVGNQLGKLSISTLSELW